MKFKNYLLFFAVCLFGSGSFISLSAKNSETIVSLESNRTLNSSIDLHLTDADNPIKGGNVVNLTASEAWLFFDNMKPSTVLEQYKNSIKINGATINPPTNCRLDVYRHGTVVIPHTPDFQPLETWTQTNYGGGTQKYNVDRYYTNNKASRIPADMVSALVQDNSIRSFKLKRGYMATFANEPNGYGYSRCFIADEADIEITELPVELDQKISFIRIVAWEWPSKKGWCGGNATEVDMTNSTWWYGWGGTGTRRDFYEFVPMWNKLNGNWSAINGNKTVSHLLGLNEPDHPEQHKDDYGEKKIPVSLAIERWPEMLESGLRVGAPAVTDFSWLYEFIDECDRRNYRVDYVPIHAYWEAKTPSSWYNDLKNIYERCGKRPLWITEWNNGANWTNEIWPDGPNGGSDRDRPYTDANAQKQLEELTAILQVLDTASFVERYSLYNWVQDARRVILGNNNSPKSLTLAGEHYASTTPPLAFNRAKEVIPFWKTLSAQLSIQFIENDDDVVMAELSWKDPNGELSDKYFVEQSIDEGNTYSELKKIDDLSTKKIIVQIPELASLPEGSVYFRIKIQGIDGTESFSNLVKYDYLLHKKKRVRIRHSSGLYLTVNHQTSSWTIENMNLRDNNQVFEIKYPVTEDESIFNIFTYEDKYMANRGSVSTVSLLGNPSINDAKFTLVDSTASGFKIRCLKRSANQFLGVDAIIAGSVCYMDRNYSNNASKKNYDVWTFEDVLPPPPATLLPEVGKTYNLVHSSGLFLTLDKDGSKTDQWKIQEAQEHGNYDKQIIKLENPESEHPDIYNIVTYENEYLTNRVAGNDIWRAIVGDKPNEDVAKFRFIREGNFVKINCLARNENQFIGVDNTSPGSYIYMNKNQVGTENDYWVLVEPGTYGVIPPPTNAVEELQEKESLLIYPTVATTILTVNKASGTLISIYNLIGNKVMETRLNETFIRIDKLTSGIYVIVAEDGTSTKFIKK